MHSGFWRRTCRTMSEDDRSLHTWGIGYFREKPEVERAAGEGASFPLRFPLCNALA